MKAVACRGGGSYQVYGYGENSFPGLTLLLVFNISHKLKAPVHKNKYGINRS